jgi:hypothetical protein
MRKRDGATITQIEEARRRRRQQEDADLRALTVAEDKSGGRRARTSATFARIPHDQALELYRRGISSAAWAVLIELDRIILKSGGRNPVLLWSSRLRAVGITHSRRRHALRQLEVAGVISVTRRRSGLGLLVTHHWFEVRH